jgi:hypothetical protein
MDCYEGPKTPLTIAFFSEIYWAIIMVPYRGGPKFQLLYPCL